MIRIKSAAELVQLICARVEILKLKADDHTWQCYTPADVRDQLDMTLSQINVILKNGVETAPETREEG